MAQSINPNEMKRKAIADEKAKTDHSRNKPTLKAASDNYLFHKNLKPISIKDYSIVVNDYLKDWNHLKLDDISRTIIQTKHSELSQRSKAQANMAMHVFCAIYNYSVEHYLDENDKPILDTDNPIKTLNAKNTWNKIRPYKTYINEDQIADWIKAVFQYKDRSQQLEK